MVGLANSHKSWNHVTGEPRESLYMCCIDMHVHGHEHEQEHELEHVFVQLHLLATNVMVIKPSQ